MYSPTLSGLVISPQVAVLCGWSRDGATSKRTCNPVGGDAHCVPGCANDAWGSDDGHWCPESAADGSWCPVPPERLGEMLAQHARTWRARPATCHFDHEPRNCNYNELVLSAASWREALPAAVQAVFYMAAAEGTDDETYARQTRAAFAAAYGLPPSAVPLLRFDPRKGDAPFSETTV